MLAYYKCYAIDNKGGQIMARPTTKDDLLEAATAQFVKMNNIIESMSKEKQDATFLFEDRDKNLRDVLAHLHEWHLMVQKWYTIGTVKKIMPQVPGEGYTWRTLPDLNFEIWKKYQSMPLEEAKQKLDESHLMIMSLIEKHTNEELFSKNVYKWTKSTTLGAYFVSGTSSHYDWAMKKIKKHINTN